LGRLNDDLRSFINHSLLRRVLEIAGIFRAAAHNLHRVQDILLLIEISVAEVLGPRQILIQICQH
jgi:hypothetical protein